MHAQCLLTPPAQVSNRGEALRWPPGPSQAFARGGMGLWPRVTSPPPSLRRVHADYLTAIRLYRQSAVEMAKLAADGREQHLLAAYPLSETASKKLLEVGDALWPGEYVPN